MTEEGAVAEAEVQPVPDMGESPGGADGGASGGDGVSHETAGADDNNDGVESSDAGTPPEPTPDPFSRRFAQLAREQKKLRQEVRSHPTMTYRNLHVRTLTRLCRS